METQNQPPAVDKSPNRKWIVLGIGGGCALIACLAIVAALAVNYLGPRLRGISNSISGNPSGTTDATSMPQGQTFNPVIPPTRDHPQAKDDRMGDPNAPVKIIEYADYQCPYCMKYWEETEPQIIQNYVGTGKVYYEYHSVGDFLGAESAAAANAAYCAADQNKFWEYHDILFANWTGEHVGDFAPDKLRQYAAAIHLNPDPFKTCVDSAAHMDRVNQDANDAKAAGVRATPSFIINGKLIEGANPYPTFQKDIDAALNGK